MTQHDGPGLSWLPLWRTRIGLSSRAALGLVLLAFVTVGASQAGAIPVPQVVAAPTALVADDGAWSWFSEPRAVHHEGATYLGWISSRGDITIGSFGPDRRTRTAVLMTGFEVNDHDHPSLLLRPDGRLQAFWSAHNGADLFTRTSVRAGDIGQWGPLGTVPLKVSGDRVLTYANPVYLEAERRLWVFGRSGYTGPAFTTSRDMGRTWTTSQRLIQVPDQRPYVKYASNGRDAIGMAFTNGHPAQVHASIFYAAYKGGVLRGASGRAVARLDQLPISPSQADLVYSPPPGRDAWVHDAALDANGRPRIVFATMPHNQSTDHDYWYAAWDGQRWTAARITVAGDSISDPSRDPSYTAGISLDHDDPSTVVLARPGLQSLEIERWRTPDLGRSWTTEAVTVASNEDNVRPVVPRGGSGRVIWMSGRYGTFTTFRTSVAGDQPMVPRAAFPSQLQGAATVEKGLVDVQGRLTVGGVATYTDKELTLQARRVGWRTWGRVATAYTDQTGRVALKLPHRLDVEYRWIWPGDHDADRSESPAFTG